MSVRVTKKVRRVIDRLAVSPATPRQISEATNIKFPALWPIIDRLLMEGWIIVKSTQEYVLTEDGRAGLKQVIADEARVPHPSTVPPVARPRPPRPPYTQRRAPWPRGNGRSR
jgi:hypothetical protein